MVGLEITNHTLSLHPLLCLYWLTLLSLTFLEEEEMSSIRNTQAVSQIIRFPGENESQSKQQMPSIKVTSCVPTWEQALTSTTGCEAPRKPRSVPGLLGSLLLI